MVVETPKPGSGFRIPSFLKAVWKWAKWPLAVILVLYVGLVLYRIPHFFELDRTNEAIAFIESQRITLEDVSGDHLPPPITEAEANATLEGVDKNENGIRDDVERAIFKLYPDSARIRAAELQYAKALQLELTDKVFNSETLVAVIHQENRASSCITDMGPEVSLKDSQEKISAAFEITSKRQREIENLIFNTEDRKSRHDDIYKKYMTSYGDEEGSKCDVEVK